MTKVIICGSRDARDYDWFCLAMETIVAGIKALGRSPISLVIHGDYRGVDTLAKDWAKENGIEDKPFKAKWYQLGPAAGPIRNQQMLDEGKPHFVIAMPGDRGTMDMVRRAKATNVPVTTILG